MLFMNENPNVQEKQGFDISIRSRTRIEYGYQVALAAIKGDKTVAELSQQFDVHANQITQLHHRRAEHWVVVRGTARITLNDDVFDLGVNEYVHIPIGATHRIENPGTEAVHIIEVQCGDYLGEDDIVCFEDKYGREGTNT